jgi:cytochrome P450
MESVVDEFDHMSSDFAGDVHGSFRRLRESCPVAYSEKHGGHWLLTRYDDVAAALKDDVSYSSARPPGTDGVAVHIPSMPAPLNVPIELDPPESLAYRRVLHPFLSPAAVEARRPTIRDHVTRCVDTFIEKGEGDLIMDLASQAPAFVIIDMIGLPLHYAPRFSTMMHALTSHLPHSPEWDAAVAEVPWAIGLINEAIAARGGTESGGDLLSWLMETQVDGQPISDEIVQSMILLLIGGGVDTTTSLTGQALMWLHLNPDKREWLRHNLDKIKWITEEFLRYSSPVTTQARTINREVEVDGHTLRPGDRVLMCLAAANHDPEQFPNPDEVVFDREINRHLAFGVGTHRCIGSNLARATFEAMVTEVLTRLPDYHVDEELATLYPAQGLVNGYVRLPATFTPGLRSATWHGTRDG